MQQDHCVQLAGHRFASQLAEKSESLIMSCHERAFGQCDARPPVASPRGMRTGRRTDGAAPFSVRFFVVSSSQEEFPPKQLAKKRAPFVFNST